MNNAIYDRIIAMWDIQESLLQSYRNIFLTSQSIIFSIAVVIVSTSTPYLAFLLLFIGIFMIFYLWIPICRSRGYDVWFFHWQILQLENGKAIDQKIFTEFKKWQALDIKEKRKKLEQDKLGKLLLRSKVRTKMELYLPWSFVILWITLALFIILVRL